MLADGAFQAGRPRWRARRVRQYIAIIAVVLSRCDHVALHWCYKGV